MDLLGGYGSSGSDDEQEAAQTGHAGSTQPSTQAVRLPDAAQLLLAHGAPPRSSAQPQLTAQGIAVGCAAAHARLCAVHWVALHAQHHLICVPVVIATAPRVRTPQTRETEVLSEALLARCFGQRSRNVRSRCGCVSLLHALLMHFRTLSCPAPPAAAPRAGAQRVPSAGTSDALLPPQLRGRCEITQRGIP